MYDGWTCCRTQQSEGESGQRRVWVEGGAGEDPGTEDKLGRGLEHGWWPGKVGRLFYLFVCFCNLQILQDISEG